MPAIIWHTGCLCGSEQLGIESQETVQARRHDHRLNCGSHPSLLGFGLPGSTGREVRASIEATAKA